MIAALSCGNIRLDQESEHAFLKSLLKALSIPASSQVLLYSATSLQLSKISVQNPRALYFNEDTYVGYIPGGKLEIISIDPQLGAIFYIFDLPAKNSNIEITPTRRCMNCHAGQDNKGLPALMIDSVLIGENGGSLDSFRSGFPSHDTPYFERMGGYVVTDAPKGFEHQGNLRGQYRNGKLQILTVNPKTDIPFQKFIHSESELITQLILDHQAGFTNRCIEAVYSLRLYHFTKNEADLQSYEQAINALVNYCLFLNEPPLSLAISQPSSFSHDFYAQTTSETKVLKTLNLKNRLFEYRCSYMVLSDYFKSLPEQIKRQIVAGIRLYLTKDDKMSKHEKGTIDAVLRTAL